VGKLIELLLTVMDVDLTDEQVAAAAQQQSKKPIIVPVDDAHPFDLEGYISGYTGTCYSLAD
jgi:COP9 signalosome complex subunit 1